MKLSRRALAGVVAAAWVLAGAAAPARAQQKALERVYTEGDRTVYWMTGVNNGASYRVRLSAVVKKSAEGRFYEEYAWSDLSVDGQARPLPLITQDFRLAVSVDSRGAPFSPPDLSLVGPLTGPVLDLMTFIADQFLAIRGGELRRVGDSFHVPSPAKGDWSDGRRVLRGEDVVDFDISLRAQDGETAEIFVQHTPPSEPALELSPEWMREPVADAPNNWVQVVKHTGGYLAAVGMERFDVTLRVRLSDGKILAATMDNPVVQRVRNCRDARLADCDEPRPERTHRRIEMEIEAK